MAMNGTIYIIAEQASCLSMRFPTERLVTGTLPPDSAQQANDRSGRQGVGDRACCATARLRNLPLTYGDSE